MIKKTMRQWEYCLFTSSEEDNLHSQLNALGELGWLLAWIDDTDRIRTVYLVRAKEVDDG
jgi:hypothetical protein